MIKQVLKYGSKLPYPSKKKSGDGKVGLVSVAWIDFCITQDKDREVPSVHVALILDDLGDAKAGSIYFWYKNLVLGKKIEALTLLLCHLSLNFTSLQRVRNIKQK